LEIGLLEREKELDPARCWNKSMGSKSILMLLTNAYDPDPQVRREVLALISMGRHVKLLAWDRDLQSPAFESMEGVESTGFSLLEARWWRNRLPRKRDSGKNSTTITRFWSPNPQKCRRQRRVGVEYRWDRAKDQLLELLKDPGSAEFPKREIHSSLAQLQGVRADRLLEVELLLWCISNDEFARRNAP
jgi:hypothetical protein